MKARPASAKRAERKFRMRSNWGARDDLSVVGRWFWETDRVLLLMIAMLIAIGLIAVAAASPAAAERLSDANTQHHPLRFFFQQLMWIAVAVPVMIGISMLPITLARRLAVAGAGLFTILLILTLVPSIGMERNGATRWIDLRITAIQPSEFLKPLYVVAMAWLLSLKQRDASLPVVPLCVVITGIIGVVLMRQPNLGETVIFAATFVALLTISGAQMKYLYMLAGGGAVALVLAYFFYGVATDRINEFLFSDGDTAQTDAALATLTSGGFFGLGPGAGTRKFTLPEPHTDYIFSVIGEEFGMIACLAIAALYLAIIARVLIRMLTEENRFVVLAAGGLVTQIGFQAIINMMVNVHLLPSKGMTLPFISYGGSSMIALSIGFGLLLAFTRRNPFYTPSPYTVRWKADA